MPLPSSINDLSTSEASNSPAGSESPTTFDNYLRWHASFIAALRDVVLSGTANLTTANLTYTGTLTGSTGVLNIGAGQIYKDAAGLVGVGTTTPATRLEVSGSGAIARVTGTAGTAPRLELSSAGVVNWSLRSNNASASELTVFRDSTECFRIKSTGQLNLTGLAAAPPGAAGDIYYDSVTNKHYGHNGTSWNALY